MTMLTFNATTNFTAQRKATSRFELLCKYIADHYRTWKSERTRKANLRFVMALDPIILRDLGFTREEIAARHDGPLPFSRWQSQKPKD